MKYATTRAAAETVGMSASTFRSAMTRARAAGVDCHAPRDQWPDARTPLWDLDAIHTYIENRTKGAPPLPG